MPTPPKRRERFRGPVTQMNWPTPEEFALVERAATIEDRSLSSFCRRAALERAKEILRNSHQHPPVNTPASR